MTFATGWHRDDDAVAAYVHERTTSGDPCVFAAAQPDLQGQWGRMVRKGIYGVFAHTAEMKLFGAYRPADFQQRGTCFPSGSMIWMADGTEKPIQDIRVGDKVLSHTGQSRVVLDAGCRSYSGSLVTVRMKGWPHSVSMTAEHPVAHFPKRERIYKLRSDAKNRKRRKPVYLPLAWTLADQLSVDEHVLCPMPSIDSVEQSLDLMDYIPEERVSRVFKQPIAVGDDGVRCKHSATVVRRIVACDERFCRIVGLYAAEGSVEHRLANDGRRVPSRVTWTFGSDEQHFADEVANAMLDVFGVACAIIREADHNVIRVRCCSKAVASLFSGICPGGALKKRVPDFVFRSPRTHQMAFIRGWLDGDGHFRCDKSQGKSAITTKAILVGVTSSAGLAADMCRLATMCGLHCGWVPRKKASHQRVRAETIAFYGDEAIRLYPERAADAVRETFTTVTPKQWRSVENGCSRKLASVSTLEVANLAVYNLEVEEDHSFIVAGLAVHNCVSRGTFRAAQDTVWTAITRNLIVGVARPIAYEPIYGGARVNIGRGSLGRGDGAVGAWAAQWVHDYGLTARGVYGSVNLVDDNESLAVAWGNPGRGVPREVIEGSAAYKVRSYNSESLQQSADACAAGYFGAQCSEWQFGNRDANGMARYYGPTAHCEELSGVFLLPTWDGNESSIYQHTGFTRQNSWGNQPGGSLELAVYGGRTETLRQGEYGIYGSDFAKALRTGEVWHFSEPATTWRESA